MLLKEFSIPFPFKAHLKAADVPAREERIQASPTTLTVPLEQLHRLGGVDNLKSDITPINNILCPSVSQSQRLRGMEMDIQSGVLGIQPALSVPHSCQVTVDDRSSCFPRPRQS